VPRRGLAIGQLMVCVATTAVVLAVAQPANTGPDFVCGVVCGTFMAVLILGGLIFGAYWDCRRSPRRAARWFGLLATASNVWVVAAEGAALVPGELFSLSVVGLSVLPVTLGAGAAWAASAAGVAARGAWSRATAGCAVVLLVSLPPLAAWTHWPYRVAFLASLPALNRLADRVAARNPPPTPILVGRYWITARGLDYQTGDVVLAGGAGRDAMRLVRLRPGSSRPPSPTWICYDWHAFGPWWVQHQGRPGWRP